MSADVEARVRRLIRMLRAGLVLIHMLVGVAVAEGVRDALAKGKTSDWVCAALSAVVAAWVIVTDSDGSAS